MRNIEIKARLADLEAARKTAAAIATKRLGMQHQVDTYFPSVHGRLKLRQTGGHPAQLVWYERPDESGPKASDYKLVPVSNPHTLAVALKAALGERVVVEKQREIYLVENVRIHLDQVVGLGTFIEFEAVLGHGIDDVAGRAQLDRLMPLFGIAEADLVSQSYSELLLGK